MYMHVCFVSFHVGLCFAKLHMNEGQSGERLHKEVVLELCFCSVALWSHKNGFGIYVAMFDESGMSCALDVPTLHLEKTLRMVAKLPCWQTPQLHVKYVNCGRAISS